MMSRIPLHYICRVCLLLYFITLRHFSIFPLLFYIPHSRFLFVNLCKLLVSKERDLENQTVVD